MLNIYNYYNLQTMLKNDYELDTWSYQDFFEDLAKYIKNELETKYPEKNIWVESSSQSEAKYIKIDNLEYRIAGHKNNYQHNKQTILDNSGWIEDVVKHIINEIEDLIE